MFLGHYAVAMGAKRVAPKISLGTFVLAAQFADLLWPIFLLLGIEEVKISPGITAYSPLDFVRYPITHSLFGITVLGIILGALYFAFKRSRAGAWIVGIVVVSHWFLDLIVHRPDLQLVPWNPTRVGLGLWNSIPGTLVVEFGLYAIGIYLYLRGTAARDRVGRYGFWALMLVLFAIYVGDAFGPPPTSAQSIAILGLGGWLVVGWAYWADAHRQSATR